MPNLRSSQAKIVVLIVEDEPIIRMFAAETVAEAGFEALEAGNADEAVRILESRRDVRVVFTDIEMPGAMDGLKLAAAVRGRWPPIEIILTSGRRNPHRNEMPERSVFIPKPYESHRVAETLLRFTEAPRWGSREEGPAVNPRGAAYRTAP
jgi:CheY-like chemotaxis protein